MPSYKQGSNGLRLRQFYDDNFGNGFDNLDIYENPISIRESDAYDALRKRLYKDLNDNYESINDLDNARAYNAINDFVNNTRAHQYDPNLIQNINDTFNIDYDFEHSIAPQDFKSDNNAFLDLDSPYIQDSLGPAAQSAKNMLDWENAADNFEQSIGSLNDLQNTDAWNADSAITNQAYQQVIENMLSNGLDIYTPEATTPELLNELANSLKKPGQLAWALETAQYR